MIFVFSFSFSSILAGNVFKLDFPSNMPSVKHYMKSKLFNDYHNMLISYPD